MKLQMAELEGGLVGFFCGIGKSGNRLVFFWGHQALAATPTQPAPLIPRNKHGETNDIMRCELSLGFQLAREPCVYQYVSVIACVCVREYDKAMILMAQYSVIDNFTHLTTSYFPCLTCPYCHTHMHTHSDTPKAPLSDFLFLFFTCVFASTFTVIKVHIASPLLSRVKWFVTICVDTEILFFLCGCAV